MKRNPLILPTRVLMLGIILSTTTQCSVSEQVKESPSTKSSGISGNVSPNELKENQAYEQIQFRLNFMDEARLAGQDILFVRQATDLTTPQQAKLQTALQAGNLPLHLRMRIFARNPSPINVQLKQLAYQLLLDGHELTSGITGANTDLEGSVIVTLPVAVDLNVAKTLTNGGTPAAFATNLADFTGKDRRLTLRIQPTFVSATGRVVQPTDFQAIDLVTKKR